MNKRSEQSELMDTETVSFQEFQNCLRHLEFINHCTLAYRPTLRWFNEMFQKGQLSPTSSILDVGSGGGDMLRKIAQWGSQQRLNLELKGVDLNPLSKQAAELATPEEMKIHFQTSDIFALDGNNRPDYIISSLFTHHLPDESLVRFLSWMHQHATCGWFINDLHRHRLPYFFIKYMVKIFPFNRLVKHDAPVSVARAFTKNDWKHLLSLAEIPMENVQIKWFFPFRYCVFSKNK